MSIIEHSAEEMDRLVRAVHKIVRAAGDLERTLYYPFPQMAAVRNAYREYAAVCKDLRIGVGEMERATESLMGTPDGKVSS